MTGSSTVQLSARALKYLQGADYLPTALSNIFKNCVSDGKRAVAVEVTRDAAVELREALSDRLAVAGFGDDYQPNDEGEMLEELIDVFFPAAT